MQDIPTVAMGRQNTVARWECRRGKTWIELYSQDVHGRASYGFISSWGAKASFGFISLRQALERIENDRSLCSVNLQQVSVSTQRMAA